MAIEKNYGAPRSIIFNRFHKAVVAILRMRWLPALDAITRAERRLSANKFIGDGSLLTGIGQGDRITSGTLAVTANSATSYVSLSTNGTDWGYLGSAASYLPTLFTQQIGISTTSPVGLLDIIMNSSAYARFHENGVALLNLQSNYTSAPALRIDGTSTADLLRISDNGAPVLYVRDGGFVGISTTTPSTSLHIDSLLDITAVGSTGALIIGPSNGPNVALDANEIQARNGDTSSTLYLQNEGGNTLIGGGMGMVGIGITPAAMLHVYGGSPTIRLQDSNNGNALVNEARGGLELTSRQMNAGAARYSSMVKFGSNDNDFGGLTKFLSGIAGYATETYGANTDSGMGLAFFTTPNDGGVSPTMHERLTIDQDGRVGISTTSPLAKLDVVGTISASDAIQVGASALTCGAGIPGAMRYSSGNMQFCNGSAWTTLGSAGAATAASSTGAIQFNSANALAGDTTNLFWDDANNRLGVGTSTPLHVIHVAHTTPGIIIQDSNTPSTSAAVFGVLGYYDNGGAQYGWIGDNTNSNHMTVWGGPTHGAKLYGGGIQGLVVNLQGNVGIGANLDSPTATLQVSGTAIITSNTEVSGTLKVAGTGSEACNAGTYGTIRYNAAIEAFQMCRP